MKNQLAIPVVMLAMLAPVNAWSDISLSINVGPPALPVYSQPEIPGDGYLWTPGYWSWSASDGDYFWVPGSWVQAPEPGYLWTPGYWGFVGGNYQWNHGYWADHIGFYGGINYGYGYGGRGYQGGRWDHGVFNYNTSVNNINTSVVHNVYNSRVTNNYTTTNVSFNGGAHGVAAQPNAEERQAQSSRHIDPTPSQQEHEHTARATPQHTAPEHRTPADATSPRPKETARPGVTPGQSHGENQVTNSPHAQGQARPPRAQRPATMGGAGMSQRQTAPEHRPPTNGQRQAPQQSPKPRPQHSQPAQAKPHGQGQHEEHK